VSGPDATGPAAGGALEAPHQLALTYRRSLGRAERTFLSGLADGRIWGSRDAQGQVTVPPVDWDPDRGAPTVDFVAVEPRGRVVSWTWVAEPAPGGPLERPYALALIRLHGATTSLLHVVDVEHSDVMRTGLAVRADWAAERCGRILDIRAFVPDDTPGAGPTAPTTGSTPPPADPTGSSPVGGADHVVSEVCIDYVFQPGVTLSGFLHALAERRIVGGRCPGCSGVYVPPRPKCPACGGAPMRREELPGTGTVTAYTVVHIPFPGLTLDLPFTCVWVRLDRASVPFAHLLGASGADAVRVGMRVEPVWADAADLAPTWESIRYFRPVGGGPAGGQP
jgi:uncharacterized OB-fold protein